MKNEGIRNVAIIAHVDHGKTTLVDQLLQQSGTFRENQQVQERVMDNNDIEKERGITILAKNTSIHYKGVKINIIDTPGHADFGGEVERVLKMVNGVVLLVDAYEGPMPQTRFVLQKALELHLKVIVVVNKIDRPDARIGEVVDEILELLMDLNATDEQLESPFVFCSARNGIASLSQDEMGTDMIPLFEQMVNHIEAPEGDADAPLQLLVSSVDYNDYVGRMGLGRIERGTIKANQNLILCDYNKPELKKRIRIANIYEIEGLVRKPVAECKAGNIVCFSGVEDVNIGETICAIDNVEPLKFVNIDEPSVEMTFLVNDSPFAGQEGDFVTSRNLRERLFKELLKDVSLRVNETEYADRFLVAGRGEMHLSILIENMRREGYEFQVSMPRVLMKEIDGVKCEPMERLIIDVPENSVGTIMQKMGVRKGELVSMNPIGSRMRLEFDIPSRGLFGYRSEFLTDTKGEGILNSIFNGFQPFKGDIPHRTNGALVSFETGESITYGLYNAQERGTLFIGAGVKVYGGMVVGISPKAGELVVNVCKRKQMSNTRSSGSDEALRLIPCKKLSIEEALEFLGDDEYLEITPKSIRIRKVILDHEVRAKMFARSKKA